MLDYDGALDLLKAISTQWAKDARKNADELPGLAAWLEMEQHEARRWLHDNRPITPAAHGQPACPTCGAALPQHNASERGAGRKRLYCSNRCRLRYKAQPQKER